MQRPHSISSTVTSNIGLILSLGLMLLNGCRVCLPSHTHSNLWARAVEDRADWHLYQISGCANPTHRTHNMNEWSKGFYRGYHDSAFALNQLPQSNYPAVWGPQRHGCLDDELAIREGYAAGVQQANIDGSINSVPLKR